MQRGDQSGQLILFYVLKLIDEHHQGRARLPGGRADHFEQSL